ncbi:hypothetical protein CY35_07G099800 [Sphagnum magellanicum]|uniref:Uncharacterized protein n=1 Tax=Sphagnum magellanicum TaxID=128215 RepID=A0ACB8HPR4_9BRYO|nr:hypothetical protein CY35_07G099800 [Sphagnum magellanicum]
MLVGLSGEQLKRCSVAAYQEEEGTCAAECDQWSDMCLYCRTFSALNCGRPETLSYEDIVKVETSDDKRVVPVSIHNISVVDEL